MLLPCCKADCFVCLFVLFCFSLGETLKYFLQERIKNNFNLNMFHANIFIYLGGSQRISGIMYNFAGEDITQFILYK